LLGGSESRWSSGVTAANPSGKLPLITTGFPSPRAPEPASPRTREPPSQCPSRITQQRGNG